MPSVPSTPANVMSRILQAGFDQASEVRISNDGATLLSFDQASEVRISNDGATLLSFALCSGCAAGIHAYV